MLPFIYNDAKKELNVALNNLIIQLFIIKNKAFVKSPGCMRRNIN